MDRTCFLYGRIAEAGNGKIRIDYYIEKDLTVKVFAYCGLAFVMFAAVIAIVCKTMDFFVLIVLGSFIFILIGILTVDEKEKRILEEFLTDVLAKEYNFKYYFLMMC